MKQIATIDAVGHVLCHDITQIIPGKVKDARFRKGHVVTEEDVAVLLDLGKEHLYVWEKEEGMLHENEGAEILASLVLGEHMKPAPVKEGKIDIYAEQDGLLQVDIERLRQINLLGDLMIATRFTDDPIKKGEKLAGTRVIPLVIEEEKLDQARTLAGEEPLLKLLPFQPLKAGIVTTGSEVYHKRITDQFTPVIVKKVTAYGVEVVAQKVVNDSQEMIVETIREFREQGADFIICSGGMSVDPDDRTPGAIKASGAEIVSYGAPVLPGAMFLLGYYDDGTPVVGLPGCVMYASSTIFDLVLPKIVAGVPVTKEDIAGLGHGGLCLNCETCHWPICGFGKGR